MAGYLDVLVYLVLIIGFGVVSLAAARLLRPSRPLAAKSDSYECGAEPIGDAWVQFPVGFYLVALLFIVFDALAVFLFPWVVSFIDLGDTALFSMLFFIVVLGAGLGYAWKKGALEWK